MNFTVATGVAGRESRRRLLRVFIRDREVHLGVFGFADQFVDLRAVGAQRLRLDDLPLILVAAELDVLLLGDQLDAAELVLVEGEQALVAQIVERLVEAAS